MNLSCTPAQVIGKLVIQIRQLVQDPAAPLKTAERSPLFQIAAHVELPHLSSSSQTPAAITGKTFADIRQEALKSQNFQPEKRTPTQRCRRRNVTQQRQLI